YSSRYYLSTRQLLDAPPISTTNGMPRRSKKSTEGKQVSSRRVSAMTTAPSAPAASSFHMNQNRSWPGVPNRYSTSSELMVIRPRSEEHTSELQSRENHVCRL